jgi:hypothetical protein
MRKLLLLAPIALAACTTVAAEAPEAARAICKAEGLERYVGQPATADTGAAILSESRARILRWIPHGSAVTMDFSEQRVNIKLTPDNRIEAVTCG